MKRTHREVRKVILEVLSDGKSHSYGDLERKANTNWKTIRDHCEDLELFESITISEDNKIKITKRGLEVLAKLKKKIN
jgi:predicted transcriptional regulator